MPKYVTMIQVKFDDENAFRNFYDFINSKIVCLKGCHVEPLDNNDEEKGGPACPDCEDSGICKDTPGWTTYYTFCTCYKGIRLKLKEKSE